jgi:hypothetical protein
MIEHIYDKKSKLYFRVVPNRDYTIRYVQHTKNPIGTQEYYWHDTIYLYEYQKDMIENAFGKWNNKIYIKKIKQGEIK